MKTIVSIPIYGSRHTGQIVQVDFPLQCAYCGGPAETRFRVDLYNSAPARGKKVEYSITLNVPYCHEHAALSEQYKKQYERVMAIITIAVILIAILGWNISNMPSESFLVPVALGVAAIAVAHKILVSASPKFREIPAMWQQGALGVMIKLNVSSRAATRLDFRFSNVDYAASFARLNDATTSQK